MSLLHIFKSYKFLVGNDGITILTTIFSASLEDEFKVIALKYWNSNFVGEPISKNFFKFKFFARETASWNHVPNNYSLDF